MVDSSTKPKRRVRTGCSTCREKKIKCDERKPTCKNCDKPGRVCRYELSKRDHHNPTVETTDLPKYFNRDDRPDYSAEQLASFRPVPQMITWTTPRTLHNFDDDIFYEADSTPTGESGVTMARVQQTATDGLEALSAAAAANYTAQALVTYTSSSGISGINAHTTSASVIDPSLDSRRLSPSPSPAPDEKIKLGDSPAAAGAGAGAGVGAGPESDAADAQLAQALLEAQQDDATGMRTTLDDPVAGQLFTRAEADD